MQFSTKKERRDFGLVLEMKSQFDAVKKTCRLLLQFRLVLMMPAIAHSANFHINIKTLEVTFQICTLAKGCVRLRVYLFEP